MSRRSRKEIQKILTEIRSISDYRQQIKIICQTFGRSYPNILNCKDFRYLRDFIYDSTPLLSDDIHTLATRVFWTINCLTDFPVCLTCGKKLTTKNVKALDTEQPHYCNTACINRSADKRIKDEQTSLKKFGTRHPMQSKANRQKAALTFEAGI